MSDNNYNITTNLPLTTGLPYFLARFNANSTFNGNNSAVKLLFDTEDTDFGNCFDTGNNQCLIPSGHGGVWDFSFEFNTGATNGLANQYITELYRNGSVIRDGMGVRNSAAGFAMRITGVFDNISLNAGDTIAAYVFGAGNNSVSTITIVGGALTLGSSWFAGARKR